MFYNHYFIFLWQFHACRLKAQLTNKSYSLGENGQNGRNPTLWIGWLRWLGATSTHGLLYVPSFGLHSFRIVLPLFKRYFLFTPTVARTTTHLLKMQMFWFPFQSSHFYFTLSWIDFIVKFNFHIYHFRFGILKDLVQVLSGGGNKNPIFGLLKILYFEN